MENSLKLIIAICIFIFAPNLLAQDITQEEADKFNYYREKANDMVWEYLIIDGKKPKTPNREKIIQGINLYNKALDIYPYHWQTLWSKGKAYQTLKEYNNAYNSFNLAYELNKNHPDVLNELMISMTDSGRYNEAIKLGEEGLRKFPERYGIRANIAVAYLLLGELDKTISEATIALKSNPGDAVTKLIIKTANEIKAGERKQPNSMQELLNEI